VETQTRHHDKILQIAAASMATENPRGWNARPADDFSSTAFWLRHQSGGAAECRADSQRLCQRRNGKEFLILEPCRNGWKFSVPPDIIKRRHQTIIRADVTSLFLAT
jgi:hypothetical protein